ncbi:YcxB family protein [Rhizosphaericola mali]|uniref:YcxB family protein n=1 Tax=Rhizosphaericola mali TaxID=2545455 RepID=A0A5P2G6W7_9BACT|nr:YcxB family protein [Rhizosphaericola mali]QES90009.1 YcxB family protein [Rhizosphaericola mali]
MQFSFTFQKNKVIQGLRYHFISRPEIKILLIVINVFAVISAILFYLKKVQPLPFLLSAFLWMILMIVIWMVLPRYIYSKSPIFKQELELTVNKNGLTIAMDGKQGEWTWPSFSSYFESPNFYHLYFSSRSFFLIPKDAVPANEVGEFKKLVAENIIREKVK